jgi:cytochrome c553
MKLFLLFLIINISYAQDENDKEKQFLNNLSYHGFEPETVEEKEGLDYLFSGKGFGKALPLKSIALAKTLKKIKNLTRKLKKQTLEKDLQKVPSEYWKDKFMLYGVFPSPLTRPMFKGERLTIGKSVFKQDDKQYYSNTNCFACHSGVVAGTVVAGLGNTHMDQHNRIEGAKSLFNIVNSKAIKNTIGLLPKFRLSRREKKELADYIEDTKLKSFDLFNRSKTRGENFAPYSIWRFSSKLKDPAQLGLATVSHKVDIGYDYLFKNGSLSPIDPNPWWNVKYKKSIYWYKDIGAYSDKNISLNFSSVHRNINTKHQDHMNSVKKILKYVINVKSPIYPFKLNGELVKTGREIFHTKSIKRKVSCSKCHGSYTKRSDFSDYNAPGGWIVDFKEAKLIEGNNFDQTYNNFLIAARTPSLNKKSLLNYIKDLDFFYKDPGSVPKINLKGPGYIAPPLDGIWASAPYFHNGSIPTLLDVLTPKIRPTIWKKNNHDPSVYDFDKIGLKIQEVSAKDFLKIEDRIKGLNLSTYASVDFRSIYNTNRHGRSNKGHESKMDNLSDSDRIALLEFLKSLGGKDMIQYND